MMANAAAMSVRALVSCEDVVRPSVEAASHRRKRLKAKYHRDATRFIPRVQLEQRAHRSMTLHMTFGGTQPRTPCYGGRIRPLKER